ncbi:protein MIZU-KUSSEI 1 [Ricinus communis]|nr:protein MIZU-KUSSEI 1 [Ricinus communis]|eukprot:XP_015581266.1 protein MIZU-KUSSEI 1 [Ricinus communis]
MTKIDALRRYLLPCFSPPTTSTTHHHTAKKRISTSLRDDLLGPTVNQECQNQENQDSTSSSSAESRITATTTALAPARPSKTMVVGTIFGNRRGNKVWFCIQFDRFSTKSLFLLELNIPTPQLVKEMQCGLVRIALECARPEFNSCPLRSIPVWTMYCNGKRTGFSLKRKATDQNRLMLKTMQSMTVGAGVIPAGFGSLGNTEEIMYMRANYEHVVGNANTESFHLINLDECVGQELSVFLMRTG